MSKVPVTKNYDPTGIAPALDPGTYIIELTEVHSEDKNGNPYTDKDGFEYEMFVFEVEGHDGNKLFDRICLDEEHPYASIQLGRCAQLQDAMGIDRDKESDTAGWVGNRCSADVTRKEIPDKKNPGQNRMINNILRYYALTDSGKKSSTNEDDDLPF